MSATRASAKKRVSESNNSKSESRKRVSVDDDFDADISKSSYLISSPYTNIRVLHLHYVYRETDEVMLKCSDIKGIMSALKQIKEKAQKDGQKKNEETISSVASDIKSILDGLKSKLEKERQNFAKALSKSSKECENLLKNETAKFQAVYDGFCKEKATHLQALKDVFDKYEEEKERLISRYEQLRKKEKSILSENEKASAARISELDESLKKKKQDDKTFSILKKTLGSFLGDVSDEDFLPDD